MDKRLKNSGMRPMRSTLTTDGIDLVRWRESVERLLEEQGSGRAADRILPLMREISFLREKGVTLQKIWQVTKHLGLDFCYTTFLRAIRQCEENTLTPLAAARRRRNERRMPPAMPASAIRSGSTARKGALGGIANGVMVQAGTKALGATLTAFRRKDQPSRTKRPL
jgi:hypothetical protein